MNKIHRQALTCLIALLVLLASSGAVTAKAAPVNLTLSAAQTASQVEQQTAASAIKEKFNGPELYRAVFALLRDYDIALREPAKRAAWIALWESRYANSDKLKTEQGTDQAVLEMISSLGNRFDFYLSQENRTEENATVEGTTVGIGVVLEQGGLSQAVRELPANEDSPAPLAHPARSNQTISDERPLIIAEIIEGAPAANSGLTVGDRIIAIDGIKINGKTVSEAYSLLKGKPGTTVSIEVTKTQSATERIKIVRQVFDIPVVRFKALNSGIAYIKLSTFMSRFAEKEMYVALKRASHSKAVVIDVRGNLGGRLSAVEDILSMLLEQGLVLSTLERQGDEKVETRLLLEPQFKLVERRRMSTPDKLATDISQRYPTVLPNGTPIVVLIDEHSASAAEILAGALQANHRAAVVGNPSLGKGIGQAVFDLPFNRRIHISTFEFFPGGISNDWTGVIPDKIVAQPSADDAVDPRTGLTEDAQLSAAVQMALQQLDASERLRALREAIQRQRMDEFRQQKQGLSSGS
jgi:carboxyl-terminal processing protease